MGGGGEEKTLRPLDHIRTSLLNRVSSPFCSFVYTNFGKFTFLIKGFVFTVAILMEQRSREIIGPLNDLRNMSCLRGFPFVIDLPQLNCNSRAFTLNKVQGMVYLLVLQMDYAPRRE